jgi:hypothetical protein
MPGLNAIGLDAVGMSDTTASTIAASFSCSIMATSVVGASLLSGISLSSVISVAATVTANIAGSAAQLSTNVTSIAASVGSLSTVISLNAAMQAVTSVSASGMTISAALGCSIAAQSVVFADITSLQVTPMFTPSLARTINVQATSPVFTGGKWWTLSDPKKPRAAKDPDSTIDITFDWSVWLDDIGSVTISDVTFTLNGVNSVGTFSDGIKTTVFVSGGTAGSAATVACKITTLTTPPRTDERTIYLDIGDE